MGPGLSFIGDEEMKEVLDVLSSRRLSRYAGFEGPPSKTYQFERELETMLGVTHCIAMNSCTSAILSGLAAIRLDPGDEVLVPGYAFVASFAAVIYAGGTPVPVEIDESLTIDPIDLEQKITPRTRAILAVHMLGEPADMDRIEAVARLHQLIVIEDVAQACGGAIGSRRLGSIGAFGAFSFNVYKTITSGDGGALTTNDRGLYERAFAFHDHGFQPLRADAGDGNDRANGLLGLNLRMNELSGAVALAQLRKLDDILRRLRANKQLFMAALTSQVPLQWRRSNCPEGECATSASCIFPDRKIASDVAVALGTRTAIETGKHYYATMTDVVERRTPSSRHQFASSCAVDAGAYRRGALPRTDDILARTVNLAVGVTDAYLGTSFGIGPLTSSDGIIDKAQEFRRLTKGIL